MRQRQRAVYLAVALALAVWLAALSAPADGPGISLPTAAGGRPAASSRSGPTAQAEAAFAPAAATSPAAPGAPPAGAPTPDPAPHAASAVLMDAASGRILWSKNADQQRPVASIQKLMTMAVVLDAIHSGRIQWTDQVSATEGAVATGGSQIWLELGENMSVRDLFIAVAVASANDAAHALAEYVGGTYGNFIQMMNAKAKALGMTESSFKNPHGLQAPDQYSSARDIALLSRYLITTYPEVLKYTSMWEYRLRGNKLWLVNRNKLLKRFAGTDGLKTGYTSAAGYGLAATASRRGTRMIAVVLGESSGPLRFSEAAQVMQYGFTHYVTPVFWKEGARVAALAVDLGAVPTVAVTTAHAFGATVPRSRAKQVKSRVQLPKRLSAPVRAGQKVGEIVVTVNGAPAGGVPLVAAASVARVALRVLFARMFLRGWPWLWTPAR